MKGTERPLLVGLVWLSILSICAGSGRDYDLPDPPQEMLDSITPDMIRAHLKFIGDALLEGRAPGTRGEQLAANYAEAQLRSYGIYPAGGDSADSYFEKIPLQGCTAIEESDLLLTSSQGTPWTLDLIWVDDYVGTTQLSPSDDEWVSLDKVDLVFVGHGIDAPEYEWNDYKVDVTDKVVVILLGQPTVDLWANQSYTYYSRWDYKYAEASRKKAKAALIVHTPETAGYDWSVVQSSWSGTNTRSATPPDYPLTFTGWMTEDYSNALAVNCGSSLDQWFVKSNDSAFVPQFLPGQASLEMRYDVVNYNGINVIGFLPGTTHPEELVVFSAHLDHLGTKNGTVYPGALDNGSGVSMVLTLAYAISRVLYQLDRTIIFLISTAEESGLLGSDYFAKNLSPLVTGQALADINFDIGNGWGATYDVSIIGQEKSTLGDMFVSCSAKENMYVSPDPFPDSGYYYRGDQFSFAKQEVPGVWVFTGSSFVGQPDDYFEIVVDEGYFGTCYHQPCDCYSDSLIMDGMVQQARVGLRVAYGIAASTVVPECETNCM
ncbi:M28 family peptidase [Pelomyxa schiedti]|nr:M28 family peptidase [Pelomyxa schiedti]